MQDTAVFGKYNIKRLLNWWTARDYPPTLWICSTPWPPPPKRLDFTPTHPPKNRGNVFFNATLWCFGDPMINFPAAVGGFFCQGGNCKRGIFFRGGGRERWWGVSFRGVIGGGQYTHTNEGYPMLLLSGEGGGDKSFLGGRGDIGWAKFGGGKSTFLILGGDG